MRIMPVTLMLVLLTPMLCGCGDEPPQPDAVAACVLGAAAEVWSAYNATEALCAASLADTGTTESLAIAECVFAALQASWDAYLDAQELCVELVGDQSAPDAASETARRLVSETAPGAETAN